MYPPKPVSITEEVLKTLPKVGNSQRATPIANTLTNQKFGDIPLSTEGFRSGAIQDFAPTNETLTENYSKTFWRGLNTFDKFGASTIAALPNFIDNQLNNGNDRIFKAVQEPFEALESRYQSPLDLKDESRSITDWLTPTFLGGPAHTAYGDLFEQIGLMGGILVGTALTGGALGVIGKGATLGSMELTGINIADKAKTALTTLLNPNVLAKSGQLLETLGATKGLSSSLSAQQVVNTVGNIARFAGLNAAQSYTEALFEGIEGEQNFIDKKKEEYLNTFGEEATGEALKSIEATARQLKDTRFGLNMAGLAITNIPFTKAFFPSRVFGDLGTLNKFGKTLNKTGDVINKDIPWFKTSSPLLNKVANYTKLFSLAPTESIEELYQLAVEKGVDNYYTNKLSSKNFENAYDNIKESIELGTNSIFSKEGAQSAILGAMLGGGASTFHNIKGYRNFNEYLDKSTKVRQEDGTTIDETPRHRFKKDIQDIDLNVEKLINPAIDPENVALGQTLQQRVSQFSASANNVVTQTNTTGMYVERAVQQQAKFDEIFPYVKKGYREVIEQKIESRFQELDAQATTPEEKQELAARKQEALQDIKTVEDYTKNVEDNFTEEFSDPVEQAVYNQLKDIAVYHRWNVDQVAKEQQEVKDTFGTQFQTNEYLSDYIKGKTINDLVEKELATYDSIPAELTTDSQKETKKRLERLKNLPETNDKQLAKKKAEFLAYQTRDVPVNYTLDDVLTIQGNTDKLNDRLKTNLNVISELDQVRKNSGKSILFLNNYLNTAKTVSEEQEDKLEIQKNKDGNKKRIEEIQYEGIRPEERQKTIEFFKDRETPLEDYEILEVFKNLINSRVKPDPIPDDVPPPVKNKRTKLKKTVSEKTASLVESKIISSIQRDAENPEEQVFEIPTKDNVKIVPFQYKNEDGTLSKETSHLFYDFGLIRTEDPSKPDKIYNYRIKIGGKEAIQISNNHEGLLIDINFVKDYINQHLKVDGVTINPEYQGFIDGINSLTVPIAFVDFLSGLRNSDAETTSDRKIGNEIFELLQRYVFTTEQVTSESTDTKTEYEVGSEGYLFRFPKTSLDELVTRLQTENYVFDQLDKANKELKPGEELFAGQQLEFVESNFIIEPFQEIIQSKEGDKVLFINNVRDLPYKNSVIFVNRTGETPIVEYDDANFLEGNNLSEDKIREIREGVENAIKQDTKGYKKGFQVIAPKKDSFWLYPVNMNQSLEDVRDSKEFIIEIRKDDGHNNKWIVTRTSRKRDGQPLYTLIGAKGTDSIKEEKTFQEIEELVNTNSNFKGTQSFYDQKLKNKFQSVEQIGKTPAKVAISKLIATPKTVNLKTRAPKPIPIVPVEPTLNEILEESNDDIKVNQILSLFPQHILDQIPKDKLLEKIKTSNDFVHLANSVKKHFGITVKRNINNPNLPTFTGKIWGDVELNEIFQEIKKQLSNLENNQDTSQTLEESLERLQQEELNELRKSDLFKNWKSGDERTTEQNIAENKIYAKYNAKLNPMNKEKFTASRDFLKQTFTVPENGELIHPITKKVYRVKDGVDNDTIQQYLNGLKNQPINSAQLLIFNNDKLFELKPDSNVKYQISADQKNKETLEAGITWLKTVMPNVSPILVNGLIDNVANGSYNEVEDLITLSKDFANKATVKHEAVHRVLSLLPKKEREEILNEASQKYGIARGESKTTTKYSQAQQNEINYALKAVDILQSSRGDETFRKGDKNNWNIEKILQELQVPKDQQDLIKSFNTRNREQIITNLLANYSYTVEINTAKR